MSSFTSSEDSDVMMDQIRKARSSKTEPIEEESPHPNIHYHTPKKSRRRGKEWPISHPAARRRERDIDMLTMSHLSGVNEKMAGVSNIWLQ
jgi:hypothetical protein